MNDSEFVVCILNKYIVCNKITLCNFENSYRISKSIFQELFIKITFLPSELNI